MPNGTYGGVRGKGTKVGQKSFVSRPTRLRILDIHLCMVVSPVLGCFGIGGDLFKFLV